MTGPWIIAAELIVPPVQTLYVEPHGSGAVRATGVSVDINIYCISGYITVYQLNFHLCSEDDLNYSTE